MKRTFSSSTLLLAVMMLSLAVFLPALQSGVGGGGQSNVGGGGGGLPPGFTGITNQIQAPNGSVSAPSYSFSSSNNTGMFISGTSLQFSSNGNTAFSMAGGNGFAQIFTTGTGPQLILGNTGATTFTRTADDQVEFGGGGAGSGDSTGKFTTAAYFSGGTTFTASGCGNTTLTGGATAGSYVSVTAGACTVTITMGNSATAVHAWACDAHDVTTAADANNVTLGTSNTTTANLVEGTVVANDVIVFKCIGY